MLFVQTMFGVQMGLCIYSNPTPFPDPATSGSKLVPFAVTKVLGRDSADAI